MSSNRLQFRTSPQTAYAQYQRDGFFVEYDVWDRSVRSRLNDAAREAARGRGDYRPLMQPHRDVAAFAEIFRSPFVCTVMRRLIGTPLSGLQSQYFFCAPGTKGFSAHQDDFQVEAGCDVFASAWSAMNDVSVDNGALVVYPGSHTLGLLSVTPLSGEAGPNQDPNSYNHQTQLPKDMLGVDVEVPAGACVFLHSHLVHGSHDNKSNRFREALLLTYIRSGSKFRPGNTAKRAEVPLEG